MESEGNPPVRAADHPRLIAIYGAPPTVAGPVIAPQSSDDGLSVIIPYRNGFALGAYYTGVFGLIPFVGLLLGPLAIIFGILGLQHAASNPRARGRVHAWVGILLGMLTLAGHIVFFLYSKRF